MREWSLAYNVGLDFRLSRLGSEGRHWNNEKSGSGSGSERSLELDPFI